MKIIFDLDGTLICSKKRLYELFCNLLDSRKLNFKYYWDLKLNGYRNQDILKSKFGYSEDQIKIFVNNWMKNIEADHYLEMDTAFAGLHGFLEKISINNQIYICTARQSVQQTMNQLKDLDILDFFDDVFITEQRVTKTKLLLNSNLVFSESDWFIGDTGHDITTGKQLGIQTCAVLSGFMNESALKSYKPDRIIDNVTLMDVKNA